jgi:hypothetical protein
MNFGMGKSSEDKEQRLIKINKIRKMFGDDEIKTDWTKYKIIKYLQLHFTVNNVKLKFRNDTRKKGLAKII